MKPRLAGGITLGSPEAGTKAGRAPAEVKQEDAKKVDPFSFDESEDASVFEREEKAKPKVIVPVAKARGVALPGCRAVLTLQRKSHNKSVNDDGLRLITACNVFSSCRL